MACSALENCDVIVLRSDVLGVNEQSIEGPKFYGLDHCSCIGLAFVFQSRWAIRRKRLVLSLQPPPPAASTPWLAVPRAPRSVLLTQRHRLRRGRDPTPKLPQSHLQERRVPVPSNGLLARVPHAVSTRANPAEKTIATNPSRECSRFYQEDDPFMSVDLRGG